MLDLTSRASRNTRSLGSLYQMGLDTGEDEDAVDCSSKKPSVLRRLCRAARPDWIVIPFGLLAVLLASSAAPMQEGKSVDCKGIRVMQEIAR